MADWDAEDTEDLLQLVGYITQRFVLLTFHYFLGGYVLLVPMLQSLLAVTHYNNFNDSSDDQ